MGERKKIFSQMFDVRPVDGSGDLDVERIRRIKNVVNISASSDNDQNRNPFRGGRTVFEIKSPDIFEEEKRRFQRAILEEKISRKKIRNKIGISSNDFENISNISVEFKGEAPEPEENPYDFRLERAEVKTKFNFPKIRIIPEADEFGIREPDNIFPWVKKYFFRFGKFAASAAVIFLIFNFAVRGLKIKDGGVEKSQEALADIMDAKNSVLGGDFEKSYIQFANAHLKLEEISEELDGMGRILVNSTKYLPYLSKISSASHIVSAGNDISQAGILISEMLADMEKIKSWDSGQEPVSYLQIFRENEENFKKIAAYLENVQKNLEEVNADDIPEEQRDKFVEAKRRLPQVNAMAAEFLRQEAVLVDILGGNGPRKYLLLFQNNQEMRATGGFIGSYGILDIFNGRVRNFFIDGIFNPDGQLKERVVPPAPIQKISADWSLHDSNWFPDFPVSAEKAAWFYEKTGGPTVDGVITMTPAVMQKMLEVTGPIEMGEYGVTVDKDNFIEKIQYEVEVDYDKELNQPKKILSDLAPKILDAIFNQADFSNLSKTTSLLLESLNEKHILIYSKNWEIEKILSTNGWSGEVLETEKDYASVINTNINGFKTDGVISESISHEARIRPDGSIVDTLTIKREHNGGATDFEWWNKVNADYMRVYVPKGSKLLRAEGQTREFNSPPLDYNSLGYRRDPQVEMEESSIRVDEGTGTRIYEDAGKTVFANWVYVSPRESVTLKYTYVLPFKIELGAKKPADTYSLLVQKQSGSAGSQFASSINYPASYNIIWKYPEGEISQDNNLPDGEKRIKMETDLKTDKFIGIAFTK